MSSVVKKREFDSIIGADDTIATDGYCLKRLRTSDYGWISPQPPPSFELAVAHVYARTHTYRNPWPPGPPQTFNLAVEDAIRRRALRTGAVANANINSLSSKVSMNESKAGIKNSWSVTSSIRPKAHNHVPSSPTLVHTSQISLPSLKCKLSAEPLLDVVRPRLSAQEFVSFHELSSPKFTPLSVPLQDYSDHAAIEVKQEAHPTPLQNSVSPTRPSPRYGISIASLLEGGDQTAPSSHFVKPLALSPNYKFAEPSYGSSCPSPTLLPNYAQSRAAQQGFGSLLPPSPDYAPPLPAYTPFASQYRPLQVIPQGREPHSASSPSYRPPSVSLVDDKSPAALSPLYGPPIEPLEQINIPSLAQSPFCAPPPLVSSSPRHSTSLGLLSTPEHPILCPRALSLVSHTPPPREAGLLFPLTMAPAFCEEWKMMCRGDTALSAPKPKNSRQVNFAALEAAAEAWMS